MSILEWGRNLMLGIEQFDEHHKHLVELINRTYDEYSKDASSGNLGDIINELCEYVKYHFEAEELWMAEHCYPELPEHKLEHEGFAEKIAVFKHDFIAGKATSTALFFFLAEWLTTHIQKTDVEYMRFATREGIC